MRKLGLIAFALACTVTAAAADYPDKAIRFVVPQAPGSNTDLYARLIGAEMSKSLGQQVIIDNRPGGAFVIGLDAIAKAPPDGYTIGMGLIGGMALTPHMVAKLPYDVLKDFEPIGLVGRGHLILVVSPQLPVKSVKELIDYAKQNPGKLTAASSANGSPGHIGLELFKSLTGTKITHVPYRGGAAAINDLIAGRIDIMFEGLASIAPFVLDNRLRALGVSSDHRLAAFPEVPTLAEAGVPGYLAVTWLGVIAPAKTPRPIIERLNRALNAALKSPVLVERFKLIGEEPAPGTPQDYAQVIKTDFAKWKAVIESANIKLGE
ncbi:MAG: tripartite tricarboxylate transporter substrate binding protein [Pseudolabrys sp.]